jgi:blue copper oxidase
MARASGLGLPRTYGIDDLPIILQDRQIDEEGSLVYNAAALADDGHAREHAPRERRHLASFAKVPRGLVRLRLLNAANARNFDLRFADGRTFHVIASDGGYLPAPVGMTSLIIAPSERFEVLVDFSDGKAAILETAPDDNMMRGMGGGMMAGMMESVGGELLRFEPHPIGRDRQAIPQTLVPLAASRPGRAIRRRRVSLDMGPSMMRGQGAGGGMRMGGGMGPPMGINGQTYDMGRIDFAPKLGDTEIWEVTPNMMAHPFHVHGVIFNVLSIGGKAPAPIWPAARTPFS